MQEDHENRLICVMFTNYIPWNESMSNSLTVFHSLIMRH